MQLHAFAVELLLDDEFPITHFLDGVLDLLGRALAEHRRESMEQLNMLSLKTTVSRDP